MLQPPWMPFAWADLGQHEIPGSSTNPKIAAYFRRAGHPEISDDETAWCAAFVGACLESAGLRCSRSLAARSYLNWGVEAAKPSLGCVTVLSRGGDPSLGHVGFLVGETAGQVVLLGGNQSDSVSIAAFDRSRVVGYRLPSAASLPPSSVAIATPPEMAPMAAPTRAAVTSDMEAGFSAALAHVLVFEGGWSDDPFDPGGATNKGITIGDFARERGTDVTSATVDQLKADLRRIPDSEVRRIYLERYWRPALCPDLPAPLAFFHFDAAVNQGVHGAARMLQEALAVPVDGEIGPLTLAASQSSAVADAIERYAEIRRRRYRSLGTFWRFGRGWLRRVDATAAAAQAIASRPPAPLSNSPLPPSRSALENPTPMPEIDPATSPASAPAPAATVKWWGESLTIWGAVLTAATTVAPALFSAFGIDIPADLLQKLGSQSVAAVQAIGGLAGTAMTIAGRLRASTSLERRTLKLNL